MKTDNQQIKQTTLRVINTLIFKEKKKVFRFNDVSLYPSEVHLMIAIKHGVNKNATEIAKLLGLTKGAISQTLSRLEKKGIIIKTKDPYKKNELTLSLTEFGNATRGFCESVQDSFVSSQDAFL